ncbi:MAG TPA: hypothetical protein DCW29_20430 [Janthinobacterium sp.]|nr:hypothetical protein [Janthinobacterium sp.]
MLANATVAPTAYYTNNVSLRASFAAGGKVVTFYSCLERKSSSSARNCTAIGSGNYSIATLGDARVLSMSNPPLLAQQLGYKRLLVERAGIVYYGYQDQSGASKSTLRLNLTAANALLTQLGIPVIAPTP